MAPFPKNHGKYCLFITLLYVLSTTRIILFKLKKKLFTSEKDYDTFEDDNVMKNIETHKNRKNVSVIQSNSVITNLVIRNTQL